MRKVSPKKHTIVPKLQHKLPLDYPQGSLVSNFGLIKNLENVSNALWPFSYISNFLYETFFET